MEQTKTILEVKEKLNGHRHEFASAVLDQSAETLVSLYVVPGEGRLGGVALERGTRCLGYFWTNRHYNVYHAVDHRGQTLVFYINISDHTVITPAAIAWRDLEVDVVITPDGRCEVLDEDEIPADLDPALVATITATTDHLVANYQALVAELERRTAALLG